MVSVFWGFVASQVKVKCGYAFAQTIAFKLESQAKRKIFFFFFIFIIIIF